MTTRLTAKQRAALRRARLDQPKTIALMPRQLDFGDEITYQTMKNRICKPAEAKVPTFWEVYTRWAVPTVCLSLLIPILHSLFVWDWSVIPGFELWSGYIAINLVFLAFPVACINWLLARFVR